MRHSKLRTRLILAFGLIALVSSMAIEIAMSVQLRNYFTTSTTENHMQILRQFNESVEGDLDSARKTITYLAFNATVQDYFVSGAALPQREQLDLIYRVEETLSTMLSYNGVLTAVNLFPATWQDRVYADKSAYFSLPEYPYQQPWYVAFSADAAVKTTYISHFRNTSTRYNMVRKVFDPTGGQWIGIVVASYDIKNLKAFATTFDLGPQGVVAVYDGDQTVYVTENGDTSAYGQALRNFRTAQDASFTARIAGQDTLFSALRSETTGWLILSAVPLAYINHTLQPLILISYVIFGFTLALTVLASMRLAGTISRPIAQLKTHMQRVMVGDFTAHMQTNRTDEIGDIVHTFNRMTEKVNALITTVYETELRQKDSENRALQAQINPHFLYNTLESIRMLAVLNDDDDVSAAIRYLGRYLRYAMDWSHRFVTLGEELVHLKNYLAVYQLKSNAFTYVEEVPDELRACRVIKMCLQPLLENSIQHGLKNRRDGVLRVRATLEGDRLVIMVSDNGAGMLPEEMARIQAELERDEPDTSANIGLMNIQHRLRLLFGKTCGLCLRPGELGGVDVALTVAANPEREEGEDV